MASLEVSIVLVGCFSNGAIFAGEDFLVVDFRLTHRLLMPLLGNLDAVLVRFLVFSACLEAFTDGD